MRYWSVRIFGRVSSLRCLVGGSSVSDMKGVTFDQFVIVLLEHGAVR
jgi:hypothetical protein